MDNQDPQAADSEPIEPKQALAHGKVIQPSQAFVEEMKAVKASESLIPPPRPPLAAQGQTGNMPPPASGNLNTVETTRIPGREEEYKPSSSRVCDRAPSLKLFGIVILILGVLALLATIGAASLLYNYSGLVHKQSSLASLLTLAKYITLVLPLLSSIVFLVSKSVTLVKALLIVMLINYAIGLLESVSILFSAHISMSFAYIVSLLIDVGFALWAWSVFTEVNSLAG